PFVEAPDPTFLGAAAGVGTILLNADDDGITRRSIPAYRSQDRIYPNVALAAARVLHPDRWAAQVSSLTDDELLLTNGTRVPLSDGALIMQWHGRYLYGGEATYPIIRAGDVLTSEQQIATGARTEETADVPFSRLRDRIVFIAATGVGTFEPRPTPHATHDPGVMIHVTTLDNYLNDGFLARASTLQNAAMTIVPSVAAGLLVVGTVSAAAGTIATFVLILLLIAIASVAYANGVWLDLAGPVIATVLSFALVMALNYFTEGRERKRAKELFSRYVSPLYVSQLVDQYEELKLGGERVPLTLLFSDIRGFTSMSERLPAEQVVRILNEYLDRMAEIVFRNGGTLDKFIGDAVMAFWGAPIPVADHARRAVDTALEMMDELRALNEKWASEGVDQALDIGIGVNTGEAVVGNIGSEAHKLDYTAIGDTVNLASRLEGLNKNYSTNIIVSQSTKDAVGDAYAFRELDDVKVKGKEQAVKIYELLGRRTGEARADTRARAGTGTLALLALVASLGLAAPTPATAQTTAKERWVDYVYQPGRWQGGRLVEHRTTNARTDTLAFVARVDTYVRAPRWRAEVRRMVNGDTLGAPTVLIGNGATVVVLTGVGSTPLANHAAANDTLVQAVVARFNNGQPVRPPQNNRFVDTGAGNRVQRVTLRFPQARADFADNLLETGTVRRAGSALARLGVETLGAGRNQEVVASAGARGAVPVQTPEGEIIVNPDTAAILRMQARAPSFIAIDAFLREASLGVYAQPARPEGES
ncbi:MAG TPA: adenylate/guanylate cyclase domain-containing protein, partial [Longimicrobiales bacterium]